MSVRFILSEGWGGTETVIHECAKNIAIREHNVSIILNQEITKYYEDLDNVKLFCSGSRYHLKPLIKSILYPGEKTGVIYIYHQRHRLINLLSVPSLLLILFSM